MSKSHTSTGGERKEKNSGHKRSKSSLKSGVSQSLEDSNVFIGPSPMRPGALPRTAESISENSNVALSQNLTFDLSGRIGASRSRVITQSVTGEF